MKIRLLIVALACVAPTMAPAAEGENQQGSPSGSQSISQPGRHPGIVSIDWSKHFGDEKPAVKLRLGPTLLRFMTSMTSEAAAEAPELRALDEIISQVRLVRVDVYKNHVSARDFANAAQAETAALADDGWESVVQAREDGKRSDVMILPQGDQIVGIVVVAAEDDEIAFVNIAGDFDAADLGKHLGAVIRQANQGKIKLKDLVSEDTIVKVLKAHNKSESDDRD